MKVGNVKDLFFAYEIHSRGVQVAFGWLQLTGDVSADRMSMRIEIGQRIVFKGFSSN
ncbi:MAG TPA: hypothetical protein VFE16_10245 [Candidatus Cybelea sp.]|jgi:hypothetical protein|nr:hypothetical protein [Candidatus Cybelea sp.]